MCNLKPGQVKSTFKSVQYVASKCFRKIKHSSLCFTFFFFLLSQPSLSAILGDKSKLHSRGTQESTEMVQSDGKSLSQKGAAALYQRGTQTQTNKGGLMGNICSTLKSCGEKNITRVNPFSKCTETSLSGQEN